MGILVTILSAAAVFVCFINPVYGTCAYAVVNIVRPNEHYEGVLFPVIPAMIVAMALSYLLHMGRKLPKPQGPPSRAAPLIVIMMCMLALHLLIGRRELLVQWILSEYAPVILLLLFSMRHLSTPDRIRRYFTSIMGGACITAGQACFIHFFMKGPPRKVTNWWGDEVIGYGELWDSYHLYAGRLQGKEGGTFENANDLGMVANWAIPGALYYLRKKGGLLMKLVAGALLAMLGTTLFLTGSRGGQLQLGITLWMVLVGGKRKVLGVILLVVAIVGALLVLPKLMPQRDDTAESVGERLELAKEGVRLFTWRPIFGVGFYNFPEVAFKSLFPHNVYLQALAETGIVGALIFFPMIFFVRRETARAVKYFERETDTNLGLLARCIGGLQFSYLIFLLFSNQFMRFTFALVMTPCLALYAAMLRDREARAGEGKARDEDTVPDEPIVLQEEDFLQARPGPPPKEAHHVTPELDTVRERIPVDQAYVFDPEAAAVEGLDDGAGEVDDEATTGDTPRKRR
jgi:O-antigen ligase